jgi:hypothetical protein
VRVAFGEQHVHDVVRQRGQQAGIVGAEPAADESRFGVVSEGGELGRVMREDIVEFGDHGVHFRDELDQAFRRQQDAVVHSLVRTFDDDLRDAVDDARQRLLLAAISSEIRVIAGLVCSATSSATCEAERPISLTKCQYLSEELVSCRMLPTISL